MTFTCTRASLRRSGRSRATEPNWTVAWCRCPEVRLLMVRAWSKKLGTRCGCKECSEPECCRLFHFLRLAALTGSCGVPPNVTEVEPVIVPVKS